jgi:parallel beta-helix repeat protein
MKIDGLFGSVGINKNGKAFFEGARTGPIFDVGAFSAYAKTNSQNADVILRASHYDDMLKLIKDSDFIKVMPPDSKINCEIFYNAGAGINIYDGVASANSNKVVGCHIHHNAHAGKRGAGIGIHTGDSNIAKDNIIHDNASGIHTDYGAKNTIIENNVLYGHSYFDLIIGDGCSYCVAKNNSFLKKENNTEILIGNNAISPKVLNLSIRDTKEEIFLDIKSIKKVSKE